jgi:hypothetical protein
MSGHWITLYSPSGQNLAGLGDFQRLECVLVENAIGGLMIQIPPTIPDEWIQRDGLLAYWRTPGDPSYGVPQLVGDTHFLISRRRKIVHADGAWSIVIHAVHPNHLLGRRIVAYDEESAQASKTGESDDVMKAIIRENFTAATDTDRNWSSGVFLVEPDVTAGQTVRVNMAYRNVLSTLQEIAGQAAGEGTYQGFEVRIPTPTGPATFRTYVRQRGQDRTGLNFQQIVLSTQNGGLAQAEVDEDWTGAASFVYVSGAGVGSGRVIGTRANAALIAQSRYGRAEYFANQTQLEETLFLEGVAARWLRRLRPRQQFVATADVGTYADYGAAYTWGDLVVGQFAAMDTSGQVAYSFPCRVDPVRIVVDSSEDVTTGERTEIEQLSIQLRSLDDE